MTDDRTLIVRRGDAEFRAKSWAELEEWARAGRLAADDYVYHPLAEKWFRAAELAELKVAFGAVKAAPPTSAKAENRRIFGCGGTVLFFFVVMLVYSISTSTKARFPTTTHRNRPASTSSNEGRLIVGGQPIALVATSEAAFDRFMKIAVANDTLGIAEMVLSGSLLKVDRGTKVTIIDRGFTKTEVRILEGDHFGESGWVASEFVRRE